MDLSYVWQGNWEFSYHLMPNCAVNALWVSLMDLIYHPLVQLRSTEAHTCTVFSSLYPLKHLRQVKLTISEAIYYELGLLIWLKTSVLTTHRSLIIFIQVQKGCFVFDLLFYLVFSPFHYNVMTLEWLYKCSHLKLHCALHDAAIKQTWNTNNVLPSILISFRFKGLLSIATKQNTQKHICKNRQ